MPDNSSSNRRIAKNTIFLSIRMIIVLAISLYTTRVILRVLGVVDYGVYNVVCGFVSMFTFLNTSMSNGIQRYFNFEYGKNGEKGANQVYCTAVIIQFLLAITVIFVVEAFGLWYLHHKMNIPSDRMAAANWIFHFAILAFVIGILQAPFSAAVTAHERFDFYAIVNVLDAFLKLGIVFLIRIQPFDKLIAYGLLIALVSAINLLLYWFYCKRKFSEIRFHPVFDKALFKQMLGFSGWNLFGSFSGVIKEHGINLVINFFYGPIVNAARAVASQVNSGIQGFVSNVLTPVRPQVIQSFARGDVQRSLSLTYSISKLSSCFFLMIVIPISLEIDYILTLWLDDNVPDYTNIFTILVLITSLVNILNGAISTMVHATGKMRKYQLWGSFVGICSLPLAFVLLRLYPYPELALVAVLICSTVGHIISLFIVRDLVGLSIRGYIANVIAPIMFVMLVTLLLSSIVHLYLSWGLLRLFCVIIVAVLTSSISMFITLNKSEKKMMIDLVSRFVTVFKHDRN